MALSVIGIRVRNAAVANWTFSIDTRDTRVLVRFATGTAITSVSGRFVAIPAGPSERTACGDAVRPTPMHRTDANVKATLRRIVPPEFAKGSLALGTRR